MIGLGMDIRWRVGWRRMRIGFLLIGILCTPICNIYAQCEPLDVTTRLTYERIQDGQKFTGAATAFYVDLSKWGYKNSKDIHYFLSASHNVLGPDDKVIQSIKLEVETGKLAACEVVAIDRCLDLCILKCTSPTKAIAKLAENDAKNGEQVTYTGCPSGTPVASYSGEVLKRFEGGTVKTSVKVSFARGCSGGPLFNTANEVVGIAISGYPKDGDIDKTKGQFIPVSAIKSFLDENKK